MHHSIPRSFPRAGLLTAAMLLAACQPSAPPAAATIGTPAETAAAEVRVGTLVIGNPTSRETPLAGGTGPGFLSIRNEGSSEDRLVSASSSAVESVEIHEMSMTDGQMQMRALPDGLPIPAGATVDLAPGGLHLMLIGVKTPLAAGQTVPVELRFAQAGTVTVALVVKARAP
jgi:copper(I)-binding protein